MTQEKERPWWRDRADQIELEVGAGYMDAARCYTQMRQLLDATRRAALEAKQVEVNLPEVGIDTANHAGIRVRGYTEQQVRELLETQARNPSATLTGSLQPLTQDQIRRMSQQHDAEDLCGWSYRMGVQDAEKAHGINIAD